MLGDMFVNEMQERDYKNFDYLDIIVKKDSIDEIINAYTTFLWFKIAEKEDKRYNDVVHLSFKRDVNVPNKDRLAYLQVHYENALNKRAEIKLKKHSKSIAAICNLAFFSLAGLFGAGVFIYFLKNILSIVVASVIALSIFALDVFCIKRIRKKFLSENIDYKNNVELVDKEIKEILFSVKNLTKSKQVMIDSQRGQYAKE